MIDLSIIVPVYNAEKYIENCINSLVEAKKKAQNLQVEILIINDGSTDDSLNIINFLESKNKLIRVISHDNIGVYPTRNIALLAILGKHVWFVDADDSVDVDSLIKISILLKIQNFDILHFGYCQRFNNKIDKIYIPLRENYLEITDGLSFLDKNDGRLYLWNNIYNVEYLKSNNINFLGKSKSLEDSLFNINAFMDASKVVIFSEVLYYYCDNAMSISRNHDLENLLNLSESTLNVHLEIINILNKITDTENRKHEIIFNKLNQSVLGYFYSLLMQNYPLDNITDALIKYNAMGLYPVSSTKGNLKVKLFSLVLNYRRFFLLLCRSKAVVKYFKKKISNV